jgi:HEAT repeat protein
LLSFACAAQTPRVLNAVLETRQASSLEAEIARAQSRKVPLWIGYAVEASRETESCCYWNGRAGCVLEGGKRMNGNAIPAAQGPVALEGGRWIAVLLRLDQGAVQKVQTYSLACELDAGGLPFVWLTGVSSGESLAVLRRHVERARADGALAAIAFHKGGEADRVLDEFLRSDQPEEIRKKTCFWLGQARGAAGVRRLRQILAEDPSDQMREQAVFALSIAPENGSLDVLLKAGREDRSPAVRSKAWFWLAQKAGVKAVGPIAEAAEQDPDTQVKRQAVFALSQIPEGQGVPKLIEVARSHRIPAVRKQAWFWLGQSKDPRAQQFIEEALTK